MATEKQTIMVRLKKGQSYILPSGAKIISLTEIDGASADSLCAEFPPSTPLVSYTFFIEKRVFREGIIQFNNRDLYVAKFVMGDYILSYEVVDPQTGQIGLRAEFDLQNNPNFWGPLKKSPGVIAVYVCSDCSGDDTCNTTITLTVPQSYPVPFFVMNIKEEFSDPWFSRLYPIDPDQPGQVERSECENRV